MMFHLDKNEGCFGFLDHEGARRLDDWEHFGSLFGWASSSQQHGADADDDFMALVRKINRKSSPQPMSDEMKMQLVPARLNVLMNAFVDVHNRVVDLCYSSLN